MATDYQTILSRAVAKAGSAEERQKIYDQARHALAAMKPTPNLTASRISAEAATLEKAIHQVEAEFSQTAVPDAELPEDSDLEDASPKHWEDSPMLPTVRKSSTLLFVLAGVAIVVVAGILMYAIYSYWKPGSSTNSAADGRSGLNLVEAARQISRDRDKPQPVTADLAPGVDGGSSASGLPFHFKRQIVFYRTTIAPGSVVIDTAQRFLYLVQQNNAAQRYGVGVSTECLGPGNSYRIASKSEWPEWKAPEDVAKRSNTPQSIPGGPGNPLGARALYLDRMGRYIHGTNAPQTIGNLVKLGCVRLVNDDIIDLYQRVSLDTRVIMRD